jgi:hypothetical protein
MRGGEVLSISAAAVCDRDDVVGLERIVGCCWQSADVADVSVFDDLL